MYPELYYGCFRPLKFHVRGSLLFYSSDSGSGDFQDPSYEYGARTSPTRTPRETKVVLLPARSDHVVDRTVDRTWRSLRRFTWVPKVGEVRGVCHTCFWNRTHVLGGHF